MAPDGPAPFPTIPDDKRRRMLEPPTGRVRMVLDTDAHNEIDDQYAIAWALLSQDVLEIEGFYAAPYNHALRGEALRSAWRQRQSGGGEPPELSAWLDRLEAAGTDPHDLDFHDAATGMEKSYQEILTVFDKLGMDPGERVFRGSTHPLPSATEPVASPAARHLVARALADDTRPLYVAAIGALTNVASALLLEPAIAERIVVLWTAGYPAAVRQPNASFNMDQDLLATQLLFDCGVPLVYLPGHMVGSQLTMSLPEMETWVAGRGAMGDYLHHLYLNNPIQQQRGVTDHYARSWVIWDLINIAWLLDPSWVPSALVPTPTLGDDTVWGTGPADRHVMREAYNLDRDAIFRDLFMKLESAA